MTITVDVQYKLRQKELPDKTQIDHWVNAVLKNRRNNAEVTIRIVDEKEGKELNEHWRKSQGPTNVLSFPVDEMESSMTGLLGDVVICAPVVEQEAKEQNKTLDAHWAHMVVHGTLHLVGYDHIKQPDADEMEALEIDILTSLGFNNPYT